MTLIYKLLTALFLAAFAFGCWFMAYAVWVSLSQLEVF